MKDDYIDKMMKDVKSLTPAELQALIQYVSTLGKQCNSERQPVPVPATPQ